MAAKSEKNVPTPVTVVIVDEVIDAASGTFGVRIELPNPSSLISSGLNCQVRFLIR
jgi:hypothetical protein